MISIWDTNNITHNVYYFFESPEPVDDINIDST